MSNLPATIRDARTAVAAQKGPVPSTVRRSALETMPAVVKRLDGIVHDAKAKHQHVVQAAKLLGEIAAVTKTASIPRDVVEERIRKTALFLQEQLGDQPYAGLADGLTEIWGDL